jgi:hypothetical protein
MNPIEASAEFFRHCLKYVTGNSMYLIELSNFTFPILMGSPPR